MARQARQLSESGYLHVIVRGIGKQILFEDSEDYRFFLSRLEQFSGETEVKVCAYCLMENHVHLLVFDGNGNSSLLMKKLGVSYASHYNRKYKRIGHLFQDRYLSEAVTDDAQLLMVFRYILNNPYKAGICPASEYPWSSYASYDDPASFVDTSVVRDLIGDADRYGVFISSENEDVCLEYEKPKKDDAWAKAVIRNCLDVRSGTALQKYDRATRDAALRKLKDNGLSIRQIERLTGINRGIIQKA